MTPTDGWARLLSASSQALAKDPLMSLQDVARLAVAHVADGCVVTLTHPQGSRFVAHADPRKEAILREIVERHAPGPEGVPPYVQALREGRQLVHLEVGEDVLASLARSPGHLDELRALDMGSLLLIPFTSRGSFLGVIALLRARTAPPFTQADAEAAEGLGARLSLLLDNDRLARESERARLDLIEKTRLYDALVQAQSDLGEGVVIGDVETIAYANHALASMLGYEPDELTRPGFDASRLWAPEARALMEERARAAAQGDTLPARYETVFLRRDGAPVHAEVVSKAIELGGRTYRIGLVRDLTERRRAEQDLEEARRQLAANEKLSALGSLVSGVAHEIRTPLTYVSNHLHLAHARIDRARKQAGPDALLDRLVEDLEPALEGVSRSLRIVEELREYARLKVGERVVAGLHEVAGGAARLFGATHRHGIRLETRLDPTPLLAVDKVQVQQVVLNLLANAAEASPPGGTVRLLTRPAPGGAELLVEDEGPGIPPDVQARMWDPFFTTKKEGTGLGLSIVRRIVEAHDGLLRVETVPGRGAAFIVHFPAANGGG